MKSADDKKNGKPERQPTIFRLSRLLRVSESTVSRLRRQGMPLDTPGAKVWCHQRDLARDMDLERRKVQASGRYRKAQRLQQGENI